MDVEIGPVPTVAFSTNAVCLGDSTLFTDGSAFSSGSVTNWEWDFGDGTFSSAKDTAHIFSSYGTHNVKLITTASNGCKDSLTQAVQVNALPVADFNVLNSCQDSASGFINVSSIPSGTVDSYVWDFGDGNVSANANPIHTYDTTGTYNVKLLSVSNNGCLDSITKTINIYPLPIAALSTNNVCLHNTTTFTDNSGITGSNILAWNWDLGDGTFSAASDTNHIYSSDGNYTITLIVTSDEGCTDTAFGNVTVYPEVLAGYEYIPACTYDSIVFTDTSFTKGSKSVWGWDFGDGSTSIATNPSHLYAAPGTYAVNLIVGTSNGCLDTINKNIVVYAVPIAGYTANNVCPGDTASFKDFTSVAVPVNWIWDFGDGDSAFISDPSHAYVSEGDYYATLIVETAEGCKDTLVDTIQVWPPPIAAFSYRPVCYGETTDFIDLSTVDPSATITQWEWDFGDGSSATAQHPGYTYTASGTYIVTLISKTGTACPDTITDSIIVYPKPSADFDATTVCEEYPNVFTDQSSVVSPGTIVNWDWDFGSGDTSDLQSPTHIFDTSGTFTAMLKVTTADGCEDVFTKSVVVDPKPVAQFDNPGIICDYDSSFFNNLSFIDPSGSIVSYYWDFGDGNISTEKNPYHQYSDTGLYIPKLIIASDQGCIDSVSYPLKGQTISGLIANFVVAPDSAEVPFTSIFANQSGDNLSYEWTFGDGGSSNDRNPLHEYTEIGTFKVTLIVTDQYGCKDTTVTWIDTYLNSEIETPNIFTPNGDGVNDKFVPIKLKGIIEIEGHIYNRWGLLMYNWDQLGMWWEGRTNQGDECVAGTYFYIIKAKGIDAKEYEFKGHVTLLR